MKPPASNPIPRTALSPFRFGLGLGAAGVVFYLACILTLLAVPREKAIDFFNSLLHGLDVEPVLRDNVPLVETLLGFLSTFILGWLSGVIIAAVYNCALRSRVSPSDSTAGKLQWPSKV